MVVPLAKSPALSSTDRRFWKIPPNSVSKTSDFHWLEVQTSAFPSPKGLLDTSYSLRLDGHGQLGIFAHPWRPPCLSQDGPTICICAGANDARDAGQNAIVSSASRHPATLLNLQRCYVHECIVKSSSSICNQHTIDTGFKQFASSSRRRIP